MGVILQHSPVQSSLKERRVEVIWVKATWNQQSIKSEKKKTKTQHTCNNVFAATYAFNCIKHKNIGINVNIVLFINKLQIQCYHKSVDNKYVLRKDRNVHRLLFIEPWVYFSLLYRLLIAESLAQKPSNWRLSFEEILRTPLTTLVTCLFHCSR